MNGGVVVCFSHGSRVRRFRMLDECDLLPLVLIMLYKLSLQDTGDVRIAPDISVLAGRHSPTGRLIAIAS